MPINQELSSFLSITKYVSLQNIQSNKLNGFKKKYDASARGQQSVPVCQHNPEGVVQHSVPLAILEVMVLLSNMASEGEAVNAAAAELETAEG